MHTAFDNDPIHEWASLLAKTLWVVKCTVNYSTIREWVSFFGPLSLLRLYNEAIHEWASAITRIPWLIQYTINYGPVHEWASVLAQVRRVIQYNISYRLIMNENPYWPN